MSGLGGDACGHVSDEHFQGLNGEAVSEHAVAEFADDTERHRICADKPKPRPRAVWLGLQRAAESREVPTVANGAPRDVAHERMSRRAGFADLERDLLPHGGTSAEADRERDLAVILMETGAERILEQRTEITCEEVAALFEWQVDCGTCFDEPVHLYDSFDVEFGLDLHSRDVGCEFDRVPIVGSKWRNTFRRLL